ncbi:hypothetical protein AVEN_52754-1 [Araneus ventricosus]|uniref:Uncharacterized protein n=1 Tax=Araneus ventricosus TaxID=182803 RepID=A0A4Y2CX59_ARAVE|nr:hypothetical protein AVEN_52754-1 [Araneus ventricosus]
MINHFFYSNCVQFSLVILKSRFEATRGLFWDGPRNFEPRSHDKDYTRAGTLPLSFRTPPAGKRLATTITVIGRIVIYRCDRILLIVASEASRACVAILLELASVGEQGMEPPIPV